MDYHGPALCLHLLFTSFVYWITRFGYAEFSSSKQAQKAIQNLSGQEVEGREIRLDFAAARPDGGGNRGTPRRGRGTPRGSGTPRGGGRGGM